MEQNRFRRADQFLVTPGAWPLFPRTILYPAADTEFAPREFFEDALPVPLAGSFATERSVEHGLDADFQKNAYHLHLIREAERVEFSDRSARQDLAATIEADQVLDLLCRREIPPAERQIGNARHVRASRLVRA